MMREKLKEARQKLGELVKQSRDILDEFESSDVTEMAAETRTKYERIDAEIDKLEVTVIPGLEKQIEREERVSAFDSEPEIPPVIDGTENPEDKREKADADAEMRAFRRALLGGDRAHSWLTENELRDLQADSDEAGGYTVPSTFIAELIKFVDDNLFLRRRGRTFSLRESKSMGAPSLDADPADGSWVGETDSMSWDTTMDFGTRELVPRFTTLGLKVSRKLVRSSALTIDQLIRERLAYKIMVTEEKQFLTGSGAGRPLGVFTASNDGIPTGQDVSTGNTTGAIGVDNIFETKYSIKSNYWGRGSWIMHRDVFKKIRLLKDGEGRYIWQPSIATTVPGTIDGNPYDISEFAPNTFTTGQYMYIFGDFSQYWIATALTTEIQLLVERFADNHQLAFIARHEVDAMPVLAEAFARGKLA